MLAVPHGTSRSVGGPDSPARGREPEPVRSPSPSGRAAAASSACRRLARPRLRRAACPGAGTARATYEQSMSQVERQHGPALSDLRLHGSSRPSQCATTPRRDSSRASLTRRGSTSACRRRSRRPTASGEVLLVDGVEEKEPVHVRLAERELHSPAGNRRPASLGDRLRGRRLRAGVERELLRRDLRLDAELVVPDRQRATCRPGTPRRERDELLVVRERDRRRVRMRPAGGATLELSSYGWKAKPSMIGSSGRCRGTPGPCR